MSQFPQPQHTFAVARDSCTFGSIIMNPCMVNLDLQFYIWKIQAWKEWIFVVTDSLHKSMMDPGPSETGVSSFLLIYYGIKMDPSDSKVTPIVCWTHELQFLKIIF
jgi:hypothetical protein